MASNPPFQVEDLTDEAFFDKLVDDDFGPTEPVKSSELAFVRFDSDEAKAFAKLGIEDSGVGGAFEVKEEKDCVDSGAGTLSGDAEESNKPLVSHNSFAFDSVVESSNDGIGSEVVSDSTVGKSSGLEGSGVKAVGWGSFYAESAQNGSNGFGSYSDFFNDLGDNSGDFPEKVEENVSEAKVVPNNEVHEGDQLQSSVNYVQLQEGQVHEVATEQSANGQDLNSSQYWQDLYPGWNYDPHTGQWYQVDNYDTTTSVQASVDTNLGSEWAAVSDRKSEVSYLQQTAQSMVGTVTERGSTERVSNWNQVPQANNGYPEHMVFDPQYPGWYYDLIAQEWRSLESYTSSAKSIIQAHDQRSQNGFASYTSPVQSTSKAHNQPNQNGFASTGSFSANNNYVYGEYGQANNYGSKGFDSQGQDGSWDVSHSNHNQQGLNMWQPETITRSEVITNFDGNQKMDNTYGSPVSVDNHVDQQKTINSFGAVPSYGKASHGHAEANGTVGYQGFVTDGNFSQQFNQANVEQNKQMQFSNDYYGSQKQVNYPQQSFQSSHQFPYAPNTGRSSAGRPPHALITFGFGGKLIVMKENSSTGNSSYGSQDPVGGSISVLNLMEIVMGNTDTSGVGEGTSDYFRALCQQSFPGPLVGGSVGNKELNKWIDERIAECESPNMEYRNREVLRLLLSLLKIACQHYGKLRSPFGIDTTMREHDNPETAVAKLFASAKRNDAQFGEIGALSYCLQKLPPEGQLRATASEVQNLLVSGRKKEALQYAQEGQLWGPALVLASQLGDQFYVDTVKQMALRQLVAGSPLRTLCLLIAGQPAEVFSSDSPTDSSFPGALNMGQQPAQFGAKGMLDDWEENLAVITANRTKDDELVIIHLGDCLWKDRSEITAAHICYLVAEANFEPYSDSARLCLIGSDHWKFPRTYASPEAIQRTELYEYSKVLGNPQFILLPFQPYKLIYAHMLAEVGKVSDSLKYCQAVLKSLKTGRSPEVETWKQLVLSLEERIRTHQQGGYTSNLAPAKLVGKLLNFFDSTASRVVGGLPPPAPSMTQVHDNEHYHQATGPRVSTSQSTMAISSLMPSASMEPISDGNRMTMHNRSVSEPDFGRSPRQVDSSKEVASSSAQGKGSVSGRTSRFSRFGFGSQLIQKTVGLVLRPRPDRQAKLGETNKFYYDEKLKRWVEEGAEPPAEEAAPPPPPMSAVFQNGTSDYNLKTALKSEGSPFNGGPNFASPTPSEHASGIPPIPSSNQFSARGRMGVRSRYVDTFNQGGGTSAKLFQSPSVPSVKPAVAANAKFFIPAPAPSGEQTMAAIAENVLEDTKANENPSTSTLNNSFQSPPPSSMTMQRFPSMDNIPSKGIFTNGNGSLMSHSRRTASWSGSLNDAVSPPRMAEVRSSGETLRMNPSSYMPGEPSLMRMPMNGGTLGDDLHEVEL